MSAIAILGSGVSALGAAHRLRAAKRAAVLYDKNCYFGGHTISRRSPDGFIFDIGPHVSFTKDERIQALFAEAVDGEFTTQAYKFNNYWQGHWVGHPAQTNLYGLPPDTIVQVIADFVAQGARPGEVRNYADWLRVAYGGSFAEQFPGRYTLKYHTTPAENLTTDWMGPRMYRPTLEEMLRGALSPATPNVHYVQNFRYPESGGFVSYLKKWAAAAQPRLEHEVVTIAPRERLLTFSHGGAARYEALISSIPLPEVVRLVAGTPAEVLAAADRLACSSCVLVNLGLPRDDFASVHISYFYDLDLIFPRVSYPHLMSRGNAPAGCGGIQVEIYFSRKYRPFTGAPSDYIEPAIRDLVRCGVLREGERILFKEAVYVPYANIIFDHDRSAALATVRGFLSEAGIESCGRYGEWGYFWTDDSFKSGEAAAERALQRLGAT